MLNDKIFFITTYVAGICMGIAIVELVQQFA